MSALRSRLDSVERTLDQTRWAVARSEDAALRAERARAAAEQRATVAELAAVEAEQIALDAENLLRELATELDGKADPVAAEPGESGVTMPRDEPLLTRHAGVDDLWTVADAPTVVDLAAREAIDAAVAEADRRSA